MAAKMFRERNPVPLGLIVVLWLVATVMFVLNVDRVVAMYGGRYEVMLPEAAGLVEGSPVIVSGMQVGRVGSVELEGKGVLVAFSVTDSDVHLGDETSARVAVETVLGDKGLVLASAGDGTLDQGSTIPMERASVPYDVTEALSDLTTETGEINVNRVASALNTLSTTVDGSAPELRGALRGVSRISRVISSRDQALQSLLSRADQFSKILADRSDDMTALMRDGNVLFTELVRRRDDIHALLVNVSLMSRQLSGLVDDNERIIGPALQQLNTVIETLEKNKHNLDETLRGMSVYATGLGEVVGSGPFFNAYVQNLAAGNLLQPNVDKFLDDLLGGGAR